ncbi:CAP domain-containing protein [Pacificoceanicola onchidii]|uniref:CAP domain-containing protein n=1 Tax=Pacificoceanicola onchidii TaxID=2562685 RepID=UPI001F0D7F5D|nr:CAP domain-containing protein [Pacificoceanicola onchidii]
MRTLLALIMCLALLPAVASAQQVRQMLNGLRAENGLGPLQPSEALEKAAMAHAMDLARTGKFSHTGSDGSRPMKRAKRQGYRGCFVAENIAKGQKTVTEVMGGWARSPGHRKNMLSRKAKEYGLVRAEGNIWVLVLGSTRC